MKTTMFSGKHMAAIWDEAGGVEGFHVPTLSAYAIEHAELTPPRDIDAGHVQLSDGEDFWILKDSVNLHSPFCSPFLGFEGVLDRARLVIHYHGIRDFELLLPQVLDTSLRNRLGMFYQEAEAVFDTESWLSFALMAGAIYEGLLSWQLQLPKEGLAKLILVAQEQGAVDEADAEILEDARRARNLVHASKANASFISRAEAMDMRRLVDRLIRQFAQAATESK